MCNSWRGHAATLLGQVTTQLWGHPCTAPVAVPLQFPAAGDSPVTAPVVNSVTALQLPVQLRYSCTAPVAVATAPLQVPYRYCSGRPAPGRGSRNIVTW